jgi:hypothetical protein
MRFLEVSSWAISKSFNMSLNIMTNVLIIPHKTFHENAVLMNPMQSTCPTPYFITSELYLAQKQIYATPQHSRLSCILLFPILKSKNFFTILSSIFPIPFFIWRINKVYSSNFYYLLFKIITMEQSIHLFNTRNSPKKTYFPCHFSVKRTQALMLEFFLSHFFSIPSLQFWI